MAVPGRFDDVVALATSNGGFVLRAHLDALGLSGREIGALMRARVLARVQHGVYRLPAAAEDDDDRFRAAVRALRRLDPSRVVLGSAAAAVHGLPLYAPSMVHVGLDHRGGASRRSAVRTTAMPPASQLLDVDAVRVANAARAALDAARLDSLTAGVIIAEAAITRGIATTQELVDVVATMRGLGGVARARVCAELAAPGAESPGESRSAVVLHAFGIPRAERQVTLRDAEGDVGRVDFLWPEHGVVGEFDGRVKYGRSNPSGRAPEDVLWREKLREDRLRALGLAVVRWTTDDLRVPTAWISRLRAALTGGRPVVGR
ncbi:type IV toxin-antitoxin system AbiEi family antitoxin domain-containing protein [Cellulomonas sp. APG4]|uniref:type IV toxin-antitoxin system AbiEi family antitoxin domain-containing protein n=1 Tax=Cellulomonas sp. APG4 TaxID=1538656 RepID=UPI001379E721|nr:type IV toxin-antitoxin system AbiEi family antitoxin domain-containing protein [Cellulomonas sp. APG4]NCT92208.1 type IV toxin-antitoxin system AbiEi family antitoxin domain-containing protein [Cellulomonas sp. APG4]